MKHDWWRIFQEIGKSVFLLHSNSLFLHRKFDMFHEEGWHHEEKSSLTRVKALVRDFFKGIDSPVYGLQFHPESIYTEHGKRMIENFLSQ